MTQLGSGRPARFKPTTRSTFSALLPACRDPICGSAASVGVRSILLSAISLGAPISDERSSIYSLCLLDLQREQTIGTGEVWRGWVLFFDFGYSSGKKSGLGKSGEFATHRSVVGCFKLPSSIDLSFLRFFNFFPFLFVADCLIDLIEGGQTDLRLLQGNEILGSHTAATWIVEVFVDFPKQSRCAFQLERLPLLGPCIIGTFRPSTASF